MELPLPLVFNADEGRAPDGSYPIFGPIKGKDGYTFFPRLISVAAFGGPATDNDPDGDYRARDVVLAEYVTLAANLYPRLVAMLKKHERCWGSMDDQCPECQMYEGEGHKPDCELAALLKEIK